MRFLAQLEPICTAIRQGYPLRIIYEERRDGFGISYSQFIRYVKQFVHAAGEATPTRRGKGAIGARGGDQVPPAKGGAISAPSGFRYRPTPGDDDLV